MKILPLFIFSCFLFAQSSAFGAEILRLAVTTSFNNSGLSDLLLPKIKEQLGIEVQLLVVGTGQALRLGRAGDVDAVLVHAKAAEEAFVSNGYGTHRREIMYNDFVILGPSQDPADINSSKNAVSALEKISKTKSPFVSRGDESGTHKKENSLWKKTATRSPNWYREVGSGMGATLNIATAMGAYTIADRASWLKYDNKGNHRILFAGDPKLFNQYSFIPVNPAVHNHVKHQTVVKLEKWLTGATGQALIAEYKIDGQQLFTPNAK